MALFFEFVTEVTPVGADIQDGSIIPSDILTDNPETCIGIMAWNGG